MSWRHTDQGIINGIYVSLKERQTDRYANLFLVLIKLEHF